MVAVEPVSLRFVRPTWASEVASPPHDALSAEERRRHLAEHPHSYLAVTRSAEDLAEEGWADPAAEAVQVCREALDRLLADDVFGPARPPAFYLYRLEEGGHTQTGLVCGVDTACYDAGMVRIHERVNQARASQLARHLRLVGAQSSPIALAFRSAPAVREIIGRVTATSPPFLDIDEGGLRQRLWAVDRPHDIATAVGALSSLPVYLIDGHHRAAAASADRREFGHDHHLMLSVLFPADELRNQAFHRALRGVDGQELVDRLSERFPVREAAGPGDVVARTADELALAVAPGSAAALEVGGRPRWLLVGLPAGDRGDIDPVRLSHHVLRPILGIDESGADPRLSYRPGPDDRDAVESLRVEPGEALFLMRPVPPSTLLAASDRGEVMPPKSTYFEPKARSGLFVRLIERDITPG